MYLIGQIVTVISSYLVSVFLDGPQLIWDTDRIGCAQECRYCPPESASQSPPSSYNMKQ